MKKQLLCILLITLWSRVGSAQTTSSMPATPANSSSSGTSISSNPSGITTSPGVLSGAAPSPTSGAMNPAAGPTAGVTPGATTGTAVNASPNTASGSASTTNPPTATTAGSGTTPSARAMAGATAGSSADKGADAAAGGTAAPVPATAAPFDPRSAPGWSMMTPQEQQTYSDSMSGATTFAQCRANQDAYMAQMQARARNLGQVVQSPATDPCAALQKQGAVR